MGMKSMKDEGRDLLTFSVMAGCSTDGHRPIQCAAPFGGWGVLTSLEAVCTRLAILGNSRKGFGAVSFFKFQGQFRLRTMVYHIHIHGMNIYIYICIWSIKLQVYRGPFRDPVEPDVIWFVFISSWSICTSKPQGRISDPWLLPLQIHSTCMFVYFLNIERNIPVDFKKVNHEISNLYKQWGCRIGLPSTQNGASLLAPCWKP